MGLLLLALVAASLCAWAGNWQWQRAHDKAPTAKAITDRPARPLDEVLAPQTNLTGQALSSPVTAKGRFQADQVILVRHPSGGRDGFWVVAPLRVEGTAGRARLPVVLGWRAEQDTGVRVPAGPVTVTGVLQQPEEPGAAPSGPVYDALSTAQLVNRWNPPVYTAYLLAQKPASGLAAVPVPAPKRSGLALQNFSYALQWFLFAGFAVFLWWRMVRDAHEDEIEAARDEPQTASTSS